MKKTFIVVSIAVVGAAANAQSFVDGFEPLAASAAFTGASGTIASTVTWEYANLSVGGPGTTTWFEGNDAVFGPNSGANYLAANFNSSTGANDISTWLMSPTRTFNNGDTISFFTRTVASPQTWPDRLVLKLSTNGASTNVADFTTTLVSVNPTLSTTGYPGAWTQFTGTVSGLGGATSGRFAFHYNPISGGPSGANSDYIGIDDVRYSAVPEPASMAALGLGVAALLRRRRK